MADDTAPDDFTGGSASFDESGNFIGDTTITQPIETVSDSGNTAESSGGFDWGGFDAFLNSADAQAAAWYTLLHQKNPTAATIPPRLGGPPVVAPNTFGLFPSTGGIAATVPPIVWIGAAIVLGFVLLRR